MRKFNSRSVSKFSCLYKSSDCRYENVYLIVQNCPSFAYIDLWSVIYELSKPFVLSPFEVSSFRVLWKLKKNPNRIKRIFDLAVPHERRLIEYFI